MLILKNLGSDIMIDLLHRKLHLNKLASRFLFWTFLLVFFTGVLFITCFITIDRHQLFKDAKDQLDIILQNQQLLIELWSTDCLDEVQLLANNTTSHTEATDDIYQRILQDEEFYEQVHSFVFIDKDGYVKVDTAASETVKTLQEINLSDRDYFIDGKQGNEHVFNIVLHNSNTPSIIFSTPVFSKNKEFQGVIFSAVLLSKLNNMLKNSLTGDSNQMKLISKDGLIISDISQSRTEIKEGPTDRYIDKQKLEEMINTKQRYLQYKNENNKQMISSYTPLFDGNYLLINERSKEEVLQSHYQVVKALLMIMVFIVILVFIIAYLFSRRILQSFSSLVKTINEIEKGNYQTRLQPDLFTKAPNEIREFVEVFNQMTASLESHERALQNASMTDQLTNIANRRAFEFYLGEKWNKAINNNKEISLLFIDVDHFKEHNDSFGHQKGDECLVKITDVISQTIKFDDYLFARYGGEEFVIVLPRVDNDEARLLAKVIRKKVKGLKIKQSIMSDRYISVSIGVGTMKPIVGTGEETLIRLADDALYEAKSKGGDQVVSKNESTKIN